MTVLSRWGLLVLGLAWGSAVAEPPLATQLEIQGLLGYVEGSACEFNRNGTWYDAHAARLHLRDKYRVASMGKGVTSSEDFIDKIASGSGFTGVPYQVRCTGSPLITSRQWLLAALARLRSE